MAHAALAEHALIDDGDLGRRRELDVAALAFDDEAHRQTRAHQRQFLKLFKAVDRIPIDRLDEVAGLKPGRRRRTVGLDSADARQMLHPAKGHEHAGEDHEGQNEIGDRPRQPRSPRGCATAARPRSTSGRPMGRSSAARHAGGVGVAVELDISPERQRADPPAGAARVHPGEQLRTEAERESVDFDAAPSSDQIVPQLMDENDQAQNQDERERRTIRATLRGRQSHATTPSAAPPTRSPAGLGRLPSENGYSSVTVAQVHSHANRPAALSSAIW